MEKTVICRTGHITPVPMASSVRPNKTSRNVGAVKAIAEPIVNTIIEVITMWRVENRLVKKAVKGTMTPITNWKTEVIHWPVVTLILNSATIVGNAALS